MSTPTLTRPAGDFGDWDDFLKFAALTRYLDLDMEPDEGDRPLPKRRARGADERAAIDQSLRGEV